VTNVALVARQHAHHEEHLRRLRDRRPATFPAFESDALLQDAVALSVLVGVQEAIDIAFHVAADEGWELAASYRDAFAVLHKHGVLDDALAQSLAGAAQLRNRIAHGYASLDSRRLWDELPEGIAAFAAFSASIAAFVRQASGGS
jgi:uncharacterized protein YutE (UPF0331/DUF86 family)